VLPAPYFRVYESERWSSQRCGGFTAFFQKKGTYFYVGFWFLLLGFLLFCYFAFCLKTLFLLLQSVLMCSTTWVQTWVLVAGGRGAWPPLDFYSWHKYSKYRIKSAIFRCFFAIFGLFSVSPPGRGLIVLFFGLFCYFLVFFLLPPPPGNFSADALESKKYAPTYPTLLRLFWVHNQYPSNFVFIGAGSRGAAVPPGDYFGSLWATFAPPETCILGHFWDEKTVLLRRTCEDLSF